MNAISTPRHDDSRSLSRNIVIVGAGGHARELADLIDALSYSGTDKKTLGYVVDPGHAVAEDDPHGLQILGDFDWLKDNLSRFDIVIGVGAPEARYRLARRAELLGASFATLVHPHSTLTQHVSLGAGSIVMAGSRLTSNIKLGQHVHVSQNCTVAHDCELGDFSSVFSGASLSGNVSLGPGVLVGTGSTIVERMKIGAWSRIGAGSTVIRDVPTNATVVGTPARVVRTRTAGWHERFAP